MFNGEEPSVSYLQLPVKRKEENHFCTRCGEMGHGRRYCQAATWCKFCTSDTHATQACQRYEKFVKDNPIVSSRRNTPVQETEDSSKHTRAKSMTIISTSACTTFQPTCDTADRDKYLRSASRRMHESREHSRKSPQNQIKETKDSDVSTNSSSKKLSGCSHGSTLRNPHIMQRYTNINLYHKHQ